MLGACVCVCSGCECVHFYFISVSDNDDDGGDPYTLLISIPCNGDANDDDDPWCCEYD